MPFGITNDVRPLLENAACPISLTEAGRSRVVRLEHPLKALPPIFVKVSGIVMSVRLLQLEKAEFPRLVMPAGIFTSVRLLQLLKQPAGKVLNCRFALAGNVKVPKLVQPLNALSPIVLTESGMVSSVSLKQFWKEASPIFST